MSSSKQETIRSTPPKGTRDFLPDEACLRDWACDKIKETYREFGYSSIETPAIENIKLLKRGEGGENLQLIFEILKRGEKLEKATSGNGSEMDLSDFGLRFDLTVPLVRYYANNVNDLPTPFKAIQIGPVWRAERPQKGRYRQFTQCDIDIIGQKTRFAELDLLNASSCALKKLGLNDFTIRINDRAFLQEIARYCQFAEDSWDKVFIAIDKLDKIGIDGIKSELSSQNHSESSINKLLDLFSKVEPVLSDTTISGLDQVSVLKEALAVITNQEKIEELKELIGALSQNADGYSVKFDPTLVRGMGYYTGPIFEASVPGYNFSVAGGGRYDNMIGKFLGRDVPACGFSIGFERVITVLQETQSKAGYKPELLALIYDEKRDTYEPVMKALIELRKSGKKVSLMPKRKDLKKQLDQIKEQGVIKFCIFKGDPENLDIKELD